MHFLGHLGGQILHLITTHGRIALFLILGIEEAGIPLPIPGDLVLTYAGFNILKGRLAFLDAVVWSVVGVSIGSTVFYSLFRFGGRPFVYKYGKYFFLPQERVHKLEKWFNEKGKFAVLIGRFMPYLRVYISGIAGLSGLKYAYFLPQVILASTIWVVSFIGLGYFLGEKWKGFAQTTSRFGYVFFLIFIGIIVVFLIRNRESSKKSI